MNRGGSGNRPGAGTANRPSQLPSNRPGQGTANRPGGGTANRPGQGTANRPSQLPSNRPGQGTANRPGQGTANRPGNLPANRPSRSDVGNFLGVAGGAAAGSALGGAIANRPSQLPANRPGIAGERPAQRPEQRPDWSERSQNRDDQWQQRVDNRNDAWNDWQQNNQGRVDDFRNNQDQRWDNLENARQDGQEWRDQNREDWQEHREELWDYRSDRANEVWDNAQDYYDDVFDDHWWGEAGWGVGWAGNYPENPWWWWAPAAWGAVSTFVGAATPEPVYIDYGMNVVYEDQTVYVDNQPVPAEEYTQPIVDLAVNVEQPPPPTPAAQGQEEEWMPLGVFAFVQEQEGDPIMFFQLSVSRKGVISGGYTNTLTNEQKPVAGQVDKTSQRVAWRIGDNTETIYETSLGNLTQDVSPLAVHFGKTGTQTWLLVRMPEPAPAGQPPNLPKGSATPPPLNTAKAK